MSDDDDNGGGLSGLSSLVRLTGVNVPARAKFIGETLVSATLSSVTLGFVSGFSGAVFGGAVVGPLVPFMVGSAVGYTFGLYSVWAGAKRRMMWYAQQYPLILAHAIRTENQVIVPSNIVERSQEKLNQGEISQEEMHSAGGYISHNVTKTSNAMTCLDEWILQGGLARITWSIVAAQSIRADVAEVQRQERQRIVEACSGE